jgi:hypothetical protein
MIFTSPLGLLALLAVPAIIGIHLFRRRFPVRPVAGLFLWQIGRQIPEGGGKISKLPITTSLILECLAALALARIVAGAHDALIDRWAAEVAAYRRPVMLRLAPEMNGDWLPWATGVNGNRSGDYVAAWRHVRGRFRRAGADNAIWVWNPIASYDGSTPLRELFPGSRQVDWLAVDGYNWGATRNWGWQTYADIFAPTVREFGNLAPRRSVMIAETGSAPDPRKARWVIDTLRSARAAGVDAVVWFEFAKETDWRLSESPTSAHAARSVVSSRGWRQGGDLAAIERAVGRSR